MDVFLVVRALDVNTARTSGAKVKVGFDGAAPTDIPETARTGEFEILVPPSTASGKVIVSQAGAWDTEQDLTFTFGALPSVAWAGSQSLGARMIEVYSRGGGDFTLIVNMVVMQLKDAQASVDAVFSGGRISYLTPQPHVIRDLDSNQVLEPSGAQWNQLRHAKTGAIVPTGKIYFAQRKTVPELYGIYRPNGMARVSQIDGSDPVHVPIPFHLFFHPRIPPFYTPYPFSWGYIDLFARYCVYPQVYDIGKAMVNQNALSPDPCVFIFPVGSVRDWHGTLARQTNLMRLFQEACYFIQRMDGVSVPLQPVGRCAVSVFSLAAEQLKTMLTTPDATFERHLREIYAFDPHLPGDEGFVCQKIGEWFRDGQDDRLFRMYTQNSAWWSPATALLKNPTLTKGPQNAQEAETPSASSIYVPFSTFWSALAAASPKPWATGTIDSPPDTWDKAHQLMPALFMSHARKKGKLWRV